MKPLFILLTATLLHLSNCTDQQLRESQIAEGLYVELLHSIHLQQQDSAQLAEANLSVQLAKLRPLWQRPMSQRQKTIFHTHVGEAATAYADIKPALSEKNYEAARIQLDRAVNELAAADPMAFERLHLGKAYDFYATWREVHTIVDDQMLCLMEWREYVWWANLANAEWAKIECIIPEQAIYQWTDEQLLTFEAASTNLGEKLALFTSNIYRGDQCDSQDLADLVETALWEYLDCFKAPTPTNELAG
ncbi:MAG: hypothetical protein AAF828_04410 [Bacteroidota bacterium]